MHGAGGDHTVWRYQSRLLAGLGYDVEAVDLPGHGHGGPKEPLTSIASMTDWLVERLADGVVVGHSMGSFVALEVARRRPEIVEGLCLVGTATSMPVHPALLHAARGHMPTAARLIAGWSLPGAFTGGHPEPGTWEHGAGVRLIERSRAGVLATDLGACVDYDSEGVAPTCPVLVVNGRLDRMTPAASARELASTIPGATFVGIPTAGHEPMLQTPRQFNDLLLPFLADLS